MIERTGDIAAPGMPAAVGAAGATYTFLGLPGSSWVTIFTLVYLAIHIIKSAPGAWDTIKRVRAYLKNKKEVDD
jgi:molybdopterin biosynthesis enzyme